MTQQFPFPARYIPNGELERPGDFYYLSALGQERGALGFMCPCGCGSEGILPFKPWHESPSWNWDGNLEAPTLNPSVQRNITCKWHGWLTKGMWTL